MTEYCLDSFSVRPFPQLQSKERLAEEIDAATLALMLALLRPGEDGAARG